MSKPGIVGFQKLDDITSIYQPTGSKENGQTEYSGSAPELIVLCSWMEAASKHVAKYTEGYQRMFPSTGILLIESSLHDMLFGTDITQASDFLESYLKSARSEPAAKQSILLHMFSNGGATNATRLAFRLLENHERLPFKSIILDSCPGRGELASGARAMAYSLPNYRLLRAVGWYVIYLAAVVYKIVIETLRMENMITRVRRILNDATMFSQSVPRLYLYSEADLLVSSQDVHDHAEEARRCGYAVVREERFLKAPHCALINEDSDRYWSAVKGYADCSNTDD